MRHASLFSGIGGLDLAAHWAGMETVVFCEREPFPQTVLRKHWPDVPIISDVHDFTRKELDRLGVGAIDIVSAGYPCQGESNAGNRRGAEDDRWLWPEVARILDEQAPTWFVGENVSGHITMGLDTVLDDLEHLNYTARAFHIPAMAIDADHERYRISVVAYSNRKSGSQAYTAFDALRAQGNAWEGIAGRSWRPLPRTDWGVSGPPVSREPDGIPNRVDRCKALGNAVSPYQFYPILAAIKQIDDHIRSD